MLSTPLPSYPLHLLLAPNRAAKRSPGAKPERPRDADALEPDPASPAAGSLPPGN